MALRPVHVIIKALDASAVGRFRAEALGWTAHSPGVTTYVGPGEELVWPDPVVIGVDVVPVAERKPPVKNRVHLDLATTSAAHQAEAGHGPGVRGAVGREAVEGGPLRGAEGRRIAVRADDLGGGDVP